MELPADWKEFIESLNAAKIKYLLVGGYAVAIHGHPRFTEDIDFFVESSVPNVEKVINVIRQFGIPVEGLSVESFARPDQVVQLGRPPLRIDVLTSIENVDFDAAWADRFDIEIEGTAFSVIGIDHLIQNKSATGRGKDQNDVEALRKIHKK